MSMTEWKEYKLGELAEVTGGKRLPKGELLVNYETSHPYIRVTDFRTKWIKREGLLFVTSDIQKKISRYIVRAGGVILSIVGSIGFIGRILNELDGANLTENCVKFNIKSTILNDDYLYYFLTSSIGKDEIEKRIVGSTQPKLPIYNIKDIDVLLPPLPEQKQIASVLSSLDDKIDLLHRQNKTLEQIAETLFRQWFVEEAEEGWEKGTIEDEFYFTMGQSPPGATLNETGTGLIFYQGSSDFGFRFPNPRVYTTAPTRIANKYETLVSVRAPVGDINMAIDKCCLGRGVAAFRYKYDETFYSYTYYKLRSLMLLIKQFEDCGTVFGSIGKDDFKSIVNLIPPKRLIDEFQKSVRVLDDKVMLNSIQIRTLTNLRDTLLPKLMSGEIRLNLDSHD